MWQWQSLVTEPKFIYIIQFKFRNYTSVQIKS